jgi:hypothetical protein
MQVNQQNVINALLWLKKHNPYYSNVAINESNDDWMKGKDKANIDHESLFCEQQKTTALQGPNYTRRDGFKCPQ